MNISSSDFYHVYKRKKNLLSTSRLWPVRRLLFQNSFYHPEHPRPNIQAFLKQSRSDPPPLPSLESFCSALAPPGFNNGQQKSLLFFSFSIIYSLSTLPTLLLFPPGTSKMFNFRHHSVGDLPEVHSKLPFPSPNLFVFFIRKVAPVILTFIVNTLNYHQINICSLTI